MLSPNSNLNTTPVSHRPKPCPRLLPAWLLLVLGCFVFSPHPSFAWNCSTIGPPSSPSSHWDISTLAGVHTIERNESFRISKNVYRYSWSLCNPLPVDEKDKDNQCPEGAWACEMVLNVKDQYPNRTIDIVTLAGNPKAPPEWEVSEISGGVRLCMVGADPGVRTEVSLECGEATNPVNWTAQIVKNEGNVTFSVNVRTQAGCKLSAPAPAPPPPSPPSSSRGMSAFFTVLFILLGVYFGVGTLVNIMIGHKRGLQAVPHVEVLRNMGEAVWDSTSLLLAVHKQEVMALSSILEKNAADVPTQAREEITALTTAFPVEATVRNLPLSGAIPPVAASESPRVGKSSSNKTKLSKIPEMWEMRESDLVVCPEETLGTGAYGYVCRGKWLKAIDVAVKVVRFENGYDEKSFDDEATMWHNLTSPSVLPLYGAVKFFDFYDNGEEIPQSHEQAAKWYLEAAKRGHAEAQYNLGVSHDTSEGVAKNYETAVEWYHAAANQGHLAAFHNLGWCYEWGHGVPQNSQEALTNYHKAANNGHLKSLVKLGNFFLKGGLGVVKGTTQAVMWYCKVAEQGSIDAWANLGSCYNYGKGVQQDYNQAVKYFREAALQGHAGAQHNLGLCYLKGHGVAHAPQQAVKWYTKAALQGLVEAQENLAECYMKENGVKDVQQAVIWYRRAANKGKKSAMLALGNCLATGRAVAKDYDRAV
ncbi:HCP-like protein [Gonapodya prolifera JEL478]|uniref:Autophagy-related protein 27 n=1 Tax=Gonapodya prolifera (strain JEL478) TaxID=1344416 RepID=A0A139A1S0_GONPJ|nr:HCP-like protein [Gonapodya prolifera JEL478]|eukprot:KXS10313.1 HCP-like protein [Gonapodya prolifera JEL478]